MMRNVLSTVLVAGLYLCLQPGSMLAQTPRTGGGMQPGQSPTTPSTLPEQQQPGANNPLGQNNPQSGPGQSGPAKMDDKKFVKEAALGGMTEVEMGKLATEKGSSESVKQFGQKLIDDHTKANDQLKAIAGKENISVPDTLDHKHQARIDKLSKLSGEQFDKAFIKDQVKDHESDIKDFQAEAQGGTDPNVKAFASSTLPVLQQHLEMAKGLNGKGGKQPTSGE